MRSLYLVCLSRLFAAASVQACRRAACSEQRKDHTDTTVQAPSYVKSGSKTVNIGTEKKDFGAESTYDKESNSIQYTTVAKFPPVRLLPNSERKRILGECTPDQLRSQDLHRDKRRKKLTRSCSHWWCWFRGLAPC